MFPIGHILFNIKKIYKVYQYQKYKQLLPKQPERFDTKIAEIALIMKEFLCPEIIWKCNKIKWETMWFSLIPTSESFLSLLWEMSSHHSLRTLLCKSIWRNNRPFCFPHDSAYSDALWSDSSASAPMRLAIPAKAFSMSCSLLLCPVIHP